MARRCLMKQRFDVPMSRHHSVGYCSAVPKGVFSPLHWSDLRASFPRATLFTMAFPSWSNCSISQQDCAKYNNITYPYPVPFTSSSCVPYPPWYQGDQGVCGWKGAPCTTSSGGYSNCSASSFLSRV